ncbi:MAG: hypothetical protein ACTSUO_03095 [Candidatus Thorarchaeota archaeon]
MVKSILLFFVEHKIFEEFLKISMATTEEKFRWENSARLLYFKHRGDLNKILEELRKLYPAPDPEHRVFSENDNITFQFVQKVIEKFKKQRKTEFAESVVSSFMEYAFIGTRQRELQCLQDLEKLGDYEFVLQSGCCDSPVERCVDDNEREYYRCLKCGNQCSVHRTPNLSVFELRRKLRRELREDEAHLIQAVTDLGFGGEKPPLIKETHKHFTLNVNAGEKRKQIPSNLVEEDKQLLEDIDQQDPRTREAIRKTLEKRLFQLEDKSKNERFKE